MIEIVVDEGFKRSFKKITKNNEELKNKFKSKLEVFVDNPYQHSLKTHKLSGKLQDYMAFSIDFNVRVLFKFIDSQTAFLIDIGTHDVIY